MDGCFSYHELKALQNLIAPTRDDSDSDDDPTQSCTRKLGPGNIGPVKVAAKKGPSPHAPLKQDGVDIWHPSEAVNPQNFEANDPREVPEYDMKYKQSVTAEDVFLGMGFKTPGSASCEWLSVFVKMPRETREKVELSVESEAIDVRSPRYRLHLPTPHPVDPNASSCKWHGDTSTLELTLKLTRELDAVNF